jgi:glycine cleavage system H lipoate-binding protein
MVLLLVLLTVTILLAVDYVLRKEERKIKAIGNEQRSPIFLSPERSLSPIVDKSKRMYHLSHSWAQMTDGDYVYVGFDDFISNLFSSEVRVDDLPLVGAHLLQGTKIWDVGIANRKVEQLSPLSGSVVDVNPAFKMNIPLSSADVEQSWILKLKADNLKKESANLMKNTQAAMMNTYLRDELLMSAQQENYLNDGGKIDPAFVEKMSDGQWKSLIDKFFPYQESF